MGTRRHDKELGGRTLPGARAGAIVRDTKIGVEPYTRDLHSANAMNEPTCPKCNSDMEERFVIDHSYGCRRCGDLESYARPE